MTDTPKTSSAEKIEFKCTEYDTGDTALDTKLRITEKLAWQRELACDMRIIANALHILKDYKCGKHRLFWKRLEQLSERTRTIIPFPTNQSNQ